MIVLKYVVLFLLIAVVSAIVFYLITIIDNREESRKMYDYCMNNLNKLNSAKDESWYKNKYRLKIDEIFEKYNMNPEEWFFDICVFENPYDLFPTKEKYVNRNTGEIKIVDIWESYK